VDDENKNVGICKLLKKVEICACFLQVVEISLYLCGRKTAYYGFEGCKLGSIGIVMPLNVSAI